MRPNEFERGLKVRKAEAEATTDSKHRDFWALYLQRHPEDAAIGMKTAKGTNQWLPVAENIIVGAWLAKTCGVYVRGQFSVPVESVVERLAPYQERLESRAGAPLRQEGSDWLLVRQGPAIGDPATWPEAIDWLHGQLRSHVDVLREVLAPNPSQSAPEGAL